MHHHFRDVIKKHEVEAELGQCHCSSCVTCFTVAAMAPFGTETVLNMLVSSLNESNLEMDDDSLPETEEPMTEEPDSVTHVDTNRDVDYA